MAPLPVAPSRRERWQYQKNERQGKIAMMYEILPTGTLATLLQTYKEVRRKIDYVLIGGSSPEKFPDPLAFHKAAA